MDLTGQLTKLKSSVSQLAATPVSDEELPDVIGDLQAVQRTLRDLLSSLLAESAGGMVGDRYRTSVRRSASRSYNTNGLLAAFAARITPDNVEGVGSAELALRALMLEDAVRLQWRWTQLQAAAERYDVTIPVAKHEITDGDPEALVGEVWTERVTVEPQEGTL